MVKGNVTQTEGNTARLFRAKGVFTGATKVKETNSCHVCNSMHLLRWMQVMG
jgi:hypothetical protein